MFTTSHSDTINFSANHNGKLLLHNFPTVRLDNTNKYYLGARHLVLLNKVELGIAEVKAVRPFLFGSTNNNLTLVDAAMTTEKFKGMMFKMYSGKVDMNDRTNMLHIVYGWVERHIQNQTTLLNNYWNRIIEEEKQERSTQSQLNFQQC
jgi:hypothetical protein